VVARRGEEALLSARFVLPVNKPTLSSTDRPRAFRGGIPLPEFASGRGVEGDDFAGRRGGVENPLDDQVVGLELAFVPSVVGPGDLQLGDVGSVDLGQRRVEIARFVTEVNGPVHVLCL